MTHEMRAYVQRMVEQDSSFLSFEAIAHEFVRRDYEVVRFDAVEIEDGKLDRGLLRLPEETIVAGGIGAVRAALQRAGRPISSIRSLPNALKRWLGRDVEESTLGDVRRSLAENSIELPIHLKPSRNAKLFDGFVVTSRADVGGLEHVDDGEPVYRQEWVDFVSEWRAYVLRERIVHVAGYRGDPLVFPDSGCMQEALTDWADAPIAYGMDWGITSTGETLLVEVNDGYALGDYGLDGRIRTAMIEARWRELAGLSDNGIGETA